jgi:endonuclease/exonuclease/phosphatase family metal-dependent hydrolase
LRDRTRGDSILLVNVHIDRERYRNQVRSAELTADRIDAVRRPGEPVLVAGDFNAFRFMRPVRIVSREAGLTVAPGNGATYHFNRGLRLFPAVDHILFSGHWTVAATQTVRRRPAGIWPSDHFPVVVDLVWGAEDDQSVMEW